MDARLISWMATVAVAVAMSAGAALFYYLGPDTRPRPETDPAVFMAPAPMTPEAPAGTPRYGLQAAADAGLIEYAVTGNGNSSGDALLLHVRRLSDAPVDVYVAPGTVFAPDNPDAQRMVAWGVIGMLDLDAENLTPASSIYLPTPDLRSYVVEAYCLDFALANPTFQDRLAVIAAPAERAAQVMYESKRSGLSISAIQSAIWIDEDHLSKQEIQEHFDASDEEIDQAFDLLKRTPPPRGRA